MRAMLRLTIASFLVLLATGCYITRKGEICSITMPQIYCDREAYDRLTKPGTAMQEWSLGDRSEDVRVKDWMECGGTSSGRYGLVALPNGKRRTGEQIRQESDALFKEIQRCMLKKNYQFIGECYDNDVSRSLPACGAP